jgi:Ni/Co efflux regulator RcnB
MKTMTATFAALLLAGVATAALAQDRDRGDRSDRAQAQDHQQAPQAPQGGHARFGAPPGPQAAPAAQPAAQPGAQPRSFERREGPGREGPGRDGQRFQGGGAPGAAPAPAAPAPQQRFERGGDRGGQRQFDHERGPREVIPPNGDARQFDRRDGRDANRDGARDGRRDGGDRAGGARDGGNRDGGRWNGANRDGDHRDGGNNPWRHGDRWQAGRAPPVFWSQNRFRIGGYRAPYGYYVRTWGFGDFLPRGWYGQDYFIGDFLDYDLPYPPPGYEWVRVGGDALMIDRYTGRVVQVVRGIFW